MFCFPTLSWNSQVTPSLPAPRNSEKSVPLACAPCRIVPPPCVLSVSLCVPTGLLDWCRYVGVRIVLLAYGQLIALSPWPLWTDCAICPLVTLRETRRPEAVRCMSLWTDCAQSPGGEASERHVNNLFTKLWSCLSPCAACCLLPAESKKKCVFTPFSPRKPYLYTYIVCFSMTLWKHQNIPKNSPIFSLSLDINQ